MKWRRRSINAFVILAFVLAQLAARSAGWAQEASPSSTSGALSPTRPRTNPAQTRSPAWCAKKAASRRSSRMLT